MTAENDQALSHAEYWDERYSKSDGTAPTHEWFRSFDDLEQFFQKNFFQIDGLKSSDNPLILHLGSGDSVCLPIAQYLACFVAPLTSRRSRSFRSNLHLGATNGSSASTSPPPSSTS
jgi:hypothetical protein